MVWKLLLALALLSATTQAQNCQPGSACFNFYMPSCHFHQLLYQTSNQQPPFNNPNLGSVTWKDGLGPNASGARQGVLNVTVAARAKGVKIFLGLLRPSTWSFNIGNSMVNNGYGGGWGQIDKDWCAEIHNRDQRLYVWEKYMGQIPPVVARHYFPTYFTTKAPMRFNVDINRSNDLKASIYRDIPQANMQFTNDQLFNLDFPVYVGLNRVIAGGRSGTGTYEVCVQFY